MVIGIPVPASAVAAISIKRDSIAGARSSLRSGVMTLSPSETPAFRDADDIIQTL
jgi:hypothetical protein